MEYELNFYPEIKLIKETLLNEKFFSLKVFVHMEIRDVGHNLIMFRQPILWTSNDFYDRKKAGEQIGEMREFYAEIFRSFAHQLEREEAKNAKEHFLCTRYGVLNKNTYEIEYIKDTSELKIIWHRVVDDYDLDDREFFRLHLVSFYFPRDYLVEKVSTCEREIKTIRITR